MAKIVKIKLEKWMTPRDRQIVSSIYQHGLLNSKQVEELFFSNAKNSRVIALRRLKKLVDGGFLKQHWYGYNSQGTMQHFTITNKGSMIVSSELNVEPSEIKVNDAGIISNIEHTSLIADFHINLIKNGFEVPRFTSDKLNNRTFVHLGREHTFEPDGMGIAIGKERTYPFFLEVDRGTMSLNYFKLKIPNYEAYYASQYYTKEFETFPLVLIITTDDARVKRMKEIIESSNKSDITYLISTFDKAKYLVFKMAGNERVINLK